MMARRTLVACSFNIRLTAIGVSLMVLVIAPLVLVGGGANAVPLNSNGGHASASWNRTAAAAYLDQRTNRWILNMGAIDHGAFCISCHTALPYALARSSLHTALGEHGPSPVEQKLLESVKKRVRLWTQVQPFLNEPTRSRGTESVLNALVLVTYEPRNDVLSDDAQRALSIMWAQQLKSGANAGAWNWFNFDNEPWESPDSQYWGATLAVVVVGTLPKVYRSSTDIQENIKLLIAYLQRDWNEQSLFNRLSLLRASEKLPGLLSLEQKTSIVKDALTRQHQDGGWSPADLAPPNWKRHDGTPQETESDGYATAFVTYVIEQSGITSASGAMNEARRWLIRNQNQASGSWPAQSWNVKRDPASDVGMFMSDAATAYAVLALSDGPGRRLDNKRYSSRLSR